VSLLLDTHAFVWWMTAPNRLPQRVHDRIFGNAEVAFLSAVTGYEIEYKAQRGLGMPNLGPDLASLANVVGFSWLPVEVEDALDAARLSGPHRDPWDRMIAAQARRRDLELITADSAIHAVAPSWGLKVLW
jgi:PIN domain nuclease of toxin-antitoxin system